MRRWRESSDVAMSHGWVVRSRFTDRTTQHHPDSSSQINDAHYLIADEYVRRPANVDKTFEHLLNVIIDFITSRGGELSARHPYTFYWITHLYIKKILRGFDVIRQI
ncbi:MAG: hypothetical protein WCI47_00125 [bacterium]